MKESSDLVRDAKAHLVQRRYDLAVETASEAIRAEPKQAMPYLIRAEALRKLGQPDRALADVAVAIRIEPNRASPFVIRAEILKKRCSFDQAIADATQAIFIDPDNAAAFSIRAECRLAIGDADGATHDAQELFRIDPTRPPSTPSSPSTAEPDATGRDPKQAGGVARGRDDSVFADGNAVDRSLKARKMISSDDAAELLADQSGYKPEIIARPLPRTRTSRSRSGRPSSLIVPAIGGCALLGVGYLLAMRGQPENRAPKPAAGVGGGIVVTDASEPVRGESEGSKETPIRPAAGDRPVERRNPEVPAKDAGTTEQLTSSPPVGKWVELRPGTPGGDRVRTFQADGTLVFKLQKRAQNVIGTWRREGNRIYFSHPSMDGIETPTEDKWFTILEFKSDEMTILMLGVRQYVWYRSS